MYKKKKSKNIYIYLSIGIVMIILITISLILQDRGNNKNNVFKNVSMFIDKIVMAPFTSLNGDKNVTLSDGRIIQKKTNKDLENEIQELKDALELNKTLTEYKPINATVLSRNKSYWFNTLTIDKGTKNGVGLNMAVVSKHGLIGKISKVSRNSSEVKLITSNDVNYKVSVAIKCNGVDYYGILNGYDKESNLMTVSGIDKTYPVNVGDDVLTSGLGEAFPSGIYIGTVEAISVDKYNLTKTLSVKTMQDFKTIHYVTVLGVIE